MLLEFSQVPSYDIRSADLIDSLSRQTLGDGRRCAKLFLMYKILNDNTFLGLRNSFVRRNVDQTDNHLRNTATDLTLPKLKREFLKKVLNLAVLCFETLYRMKQSSLSQSLHLKALLDYSWVLTSCVS